MTSSLLPTYARADLAFDHGNGVWLTATTGERYLDFGAGIAVASLGYSHPHLVEALVKQGGKLWHTSNLFQIPEAERLAARLTEATFADYVFFTNSGAEAVEGAIKTARKYQSACGHPDKYRIITFKGAFHGRTIATVSAGGNPKYMEGFGPKLEGFDNVEFGDLEAAKAAIGPHTGAILVEPIQGEAGIRVGSAEFLRGLRALCDEHGLLLILDEVQTGVGRTGKFFACELSGIKPDIMAIAKGIGGGFPLGAFLATREAAKGMVVGTHGTTYGGNPLATSVGNAVLDVVLKPGFLADVASLGATLKRGLVGLQDAHPGVVAEIRGEGLMLGIALRVPVADFVAAARAEKIVVIPAGDNVARVLPPLIITEEEIAEGLSRLDAACRHFESSQAAALSEAEG
ncbi:Acetylornithine aminotransferase [Methylocella tundrae]|uniref:Acetylornithine aminotransferase n=1 Tax=Methylocella tundrae TaxID=227605 RepID=A0A8B6M6C5_METTU|nr:aspartate aminotransferase family protein [Methylocella tundrae]VTZ27647.1 Acetylornithine aminotransferase [Methylocella tundrae]VTZ49870.1 Acetylornithine aminotransferase [Methylocella tundrae]